MKKQSGTSLPEFPHKVFSYVDDDGLALLEALTKRRGGVSRAALVRMLIFEEAERVGIRDGGAE